MQLQTLTFVFLFLPMSVLLFYLCPNRLKSGSLAAISLLFYLLGDPTFLPLMLVSIAFDYGMAAWIVKAKGNLRQRKIPLLLCVVKNLGLILGYGVALQLYRVPMPLGLLVITTTSMGYVIDIYNGDEHFDYNPANFILFCTFFGKLFAGPIIQYSELRHSLEAYSAASCPTEGQAESSKSFCWRSPAFSLAGLSRGLGSFVGGLAKVVILAGGSGKVHSLIQAIPEDGVTVLSYWMLIISFTFSLYFSLSGYCDMARGLAALFGLELPVNFSHPFQSRTVGDFFNRFNITVTKFINRYVYVFLGGDTNGVLSTVLNTLLTTMLMGLWFGIKLNFLVWGIYFTTFILLEKFYLLKYLEKLPPILDRCYTFATVTLSFTIFAGSTLRESCVFLLSMFGLGGLPVANSRINYILTTNYLLIALCFLFATSILPLAVGYMREHFPNLSDIMSVVCTIGLLAVTVSFML